jgi:hypothetical protein
MRGRFRFASLLVIVAIANFAVAQTPASRRSVAVQNVWHVPVSGNLMPHFEQANGRKMLYVDGYPFTVLAVEIPWWDLIIGHYRETQGSYDYLYPAAEKMGLNALKVPVKWSMIEPDQGAYDFSYIDHAKALAEQHHLKLVLNWFGHYASGDGTLYNNLSGAVYAPMYIINDEKTYPRAVDGDGIAHHNVASYDYDAIIEREIAAFRAFMQHLKQVDSQNHTVVMIQVENEISTFGSDRHNPKLWRDHSPASNAIFKQQGFTDDLKYSAERFSSNWIRRLTDAGAQAYPLPFFHNYVGGKVAEWMTGGAPGEDVATSLKNCPNLSFIGVNSYFCAQWTADNNCARPAQGTIEELREPLRRYSVGRNLPAITETNSGANTIASRLAYIAVGEFGAPIFAPWALTDSYPEPYEPYVRRDGTLANGAFALRDAYTSLSKALPQISFYAGTDKLKVFMSDIPGQSFSRTEEINGASVSVKGEHDGQAIVIHAAGQEFLIAGFRASVAFKDQVFAWPAVQKVRVERVRWNGMGWSDDGEPEYDIDQSTKTLNVDLDHPEAVRVSW